MMNSKCELEPEELTADQVVAEDLANICRRLEAEFSTMKGKTLFISSAAGFLGQ
jgi:hypothetical protein